MTEGQKHFPNYNGLGQTLENNSQVKEERLKSAKLPLYDLRLHLGTGG